jgi:hypothetical protein
MKSVIEKSRFHPDTTAFRQRGYAQESGIFLLPKKRHASSLIYMGNPVWLLPA